MRIVCTEPADIIQVQVAFFEIQFNTADNTYIPHSLMGSKKEEEISN